MNLNKINIYKKNYNKQHHSLRSYQRLPKYSTVGLEYDKLVGSIGSPEVRFNSQKKKQCHY